MLREILLKGDVWGGAVAKGIGTIMMEFCSGKARLGSTLGKEEFIAKEQAGVSAWK